MTGALLACDPGPTQSAYVVLGSDGAILARDKLSNEALLLMMRSLPLFGLNEISAVAVEMIGHYGMGMPAGSEVFDTCKIIGRMEEICDRAGLGFPRLVMRREVKMHLCGSMKANDSTIRQALIDKLGPVGTKANRGPCYGITGDVWQALACAVTARETTEQKREAA